MLRSAALIGLVCITSSLTACSGGATTRDGAGSTRIPDLPGDAVPRQEARSRYGNGPVYEVFGKRYTVMPSSSGYRERGVASWYGKKFHGRLTSNREVYDMYTMTAAHKTLPLPSYVRVRNLRNNKSIVVRVNDRGPFVSNRIIDLSYAAATKLDMIRAGTSLVEVTAISFDAPAGDHPTRIVTPSAPPLVAPPVDALPPAETPPAAAVVTPESRIFVQVGAFGDKLNATRRLAALTKASISNAFIHEDKSTSAALFRVRIGPIADVIQYDVLVEELYNLGIDDPYLITE